MSSPNPAATGAQSVPCSPDNQSPETLTPKKSQHKNEPVLVSYLLDVSHLGMIKLLNAKKSGTVLLKDPTIEKRIYSETPWVLTQNRLPALPESQEHLFYSSRSLQEGSDTNFQRQLDGTGLNDVLHYKRNNGITEVYDPELCEIVGRVHFFTLMFSGYEKKSKDISTHWHMVEYESFEGDAMMSLCKLRLESKDVKAAWANVGKMESNLKTAVFAARKEKLKLKVNQLPVENEAARAVVDAKRSVDDAKRSVDEAINVLNIENLKNYQAIVGPRIVQAAAAAAADAADDDFGGWALGIGLNYEIVNDATKVAEGKAKE